MGLFRDRLRACKPSEPSHFFAPERALLLVFEFWSFLNAIETKIHVRMSENHRNLRKSENSDEKIRFAGSVQRPLRACKPTEPSHFFAPERVLLLVFAFWSFLNAIKILETQNINYCAKYDIYNSINLMKIIPPLVLADTFSLGL